MIFAFLLRPPDLDYLDLRYEEVLNLDEDEVELLWTQLQDVRQDRMSKAPKMPGKGLKY